MAISIRGNAGAWAVSTATTQTVTLPTHAAGDMLLVRVAFKHATMPTTVTCGTAGWAKVSTQYNNGTNASGNGTGSVIVAVFWKEAASSSETSPVITYHASVGASPGTCCPVVYQKAAGETWVTPVGAGGSVGTSTSLSATITSHVSTTAGDMVDFFHSQGDNNALTVPTFTQAGLTLGTVAEQPDTAGIFSDSNDIDADGGYRLVSSGTSSAAAVVTGTSAAGDEGSAWTTRLRVQASSNRNANVVNTGGGVLTSVRVKGGLVAAVDTGGGVVVVSQRKAATSSPLYASTVRTDSPVGYWRLGEGSGYPRDSSGVNHATAIGGTPTYGVVGAIGCDVDTAMTFNGTTDYVSIPDATPLDVGDTFSIEAWVQRGATGAHRAIASKGTLGPYLRINSAGKLNLLKSRTTDMCTSNAVVPTTGWHHVAATKSGATVHLYCDGVEMANGGYNPATVASNALAFHIGCDYDGAARYEYQNGSLDEVAFYSIVLSASQIAAHYAAGLSRTGGGVAVVDGAKTVVNKDVSATATGGGVVVASGQHGTSRAVTATGGGVVAASGMKGAVRSQALTGGGVTVIDYSRTGDNRDYSAVLTGGGVYTHAQSKGAIRSHALTGGGVLTSTRIKGAVRSQALTGGGILTSTRVKGALRAVVDTGGGVVVASGGKGAQRATVATGGGVAAITKLHAGTLAATATGGGVLTSTRIKGAASDGDATGGGVYTHDYTRTGGGSNRNASVVSTGGGVLTSVHVKGALSTFLGTGGGVAVPSGRKGVLRLVTGTGGGVAAIDYEATGGTPVVPDPRSNNDGDRDWGRVDPVKQAAGKRRAEEEAYEAARSDAEAVLLWLLIAD